MISYTYSSETRLSCFWGSQNKSVRASVSMSDTNNNNYTSRLLPASLSPEWIFRCNPYWISTLHSWCKVVVILIWWSSVQKTDKKIRITLSIGGNRYLVLKLCCWIIDCVSDYKPIIIEWGISLSKNLFDNWFVNFKFIFSIKTFKSKWRFFLRIKSSNSDD